METTDSLASLLRQYMAAVGWSERQLAERSDIPRGTIRNWLRGVVKKPRSWRDLIQVAAAMRLEINQVDQLLTSANHPPIFELRHLTQNDLEKKLLQPWLARMQKQQVNAPFQVIPDIPYFVGREEELATLRARLLQEHHTTLYMLYGMGGVGKTTLAARLAYDCRHHFSDGILWARVDTSSVMANLGLFADAYGVSVNQYSDEATRSQAVRNLLAGKRALIVLDNVERSEQVRRLLPPTGKCAVLITTRKRNLRVARGASHFHIRPFSTKREEAVTLFSHIVGKEAVHAEKKTFVAIADSLGHLPLATAIIAGRLAYEPGWTTARILQQLMETKKRLDAVADEDQSIHATFEIGYQALPAHLQTFFAALGVFEGDDFGLEAITAVTTTTLEEAHKNAVQLCSLSLLQHGKKDRFHLHPLLKDYARLQQKDPLIYKQSIQYFISFLKTHKNNYEIIDTEFLNLLGVLTQALEHNLLSLYVEGVHNISHFLTIRGLYDIAAFHLNRACQVAENISDLPNLVRLNNHLGQLEIRWGNVTKGIDSHKRSLHLAHLSEEPALIGDAYRYLGMAYHQQGDYKQAEQFWADGLALAKEHHLIRLQCTLLNGLGALAINDKADFKRAKQLYEEGLILARQLEDRPTSALILMNLGFLAFRAGDYKYTTQYYDESGQLADAIGFRLLQAILSQRQAQLLLAHTGAYQHAGKALIAGETIAKELNNPRVLAMLVTALGEYSLRLGNHNQAKTYLTQAHDLAKSVGDADLLIEVLRHRSILAATQKELSAAKSYIDQAHTLGKRVPDPWYRCQVLLSRGSLSFLQEDFSAASADWRMALDVAKQYSFEAQVGIAQLGLAQLAFASGDRAAMLAHGQQSLATFSKIDHIYQRTVQSWLLEPRYIWSLLHKPPTLK
ncbi:NB-ARC domain-containing protein [Candidatus Leptofilum sp.]|uniref:NB-ARC domain-containing protein n=1 Tax=Candidatus Leptofilum sp. TaxID=3241576 RepID=UPI003B5AD4CD